MKSQHHTVMNTSVQPQWCSGHIYIDRKHWPRQIYGSATDNNQEFWNDVIKPRIWLIINASVGTTLLNNVCRRSLQERKDLVRTRVTADKTWLPARKELLWNMLPAGCGFAVGWLLSLLLKTGSSFRPYNRKRPSRQRSPGVRHPRQQFTLRVKNIKAQITVTQDFRSWSP